MCDTRRGTRFVLEMQTSVHMHIWTRTRRVGRVTKGLWGKWLPLDPRGVCPFSSPGQALEVVWVAQAGTTQPHLRRSPQDCCLFPLHQPRTGS